MNNTIIPIEYKSQRILITEQLAEEYGADVRNIHDNYGNHKDNFIEGIHYYYLEGDSLKAFKESLPDDIGEPIKFAPRLYLWTERGASRHCKILDTDEAWEQFDRLEETYFNPAKHNLPAVGLSGVVNSEFMFQIATRMKQLEEDNKEKQLLLESQQPKVEFFNQVTDSTDAIDIGETAKVLNMGIRRNKLFAFLRYKGVLMPGNQPYQEFIDREYFRTIEQKYSRADGSIHINIKTVVYQKGLDYIRKLYMRETGGFSIVEAE